MIKECPILINNDAVTVVKYENVEVQLPSIKRAANTVHVLFNGNSYKIVDENYKEENVVIKTTTKQRATKRKKPVVMSEPAEQE